jgi:hypothetical protein
MELTPSHMNTRDFNYLVQLSTPPTWVLSYCNRLERFLVLIKRGAVLLWSQKFLVS